MARGYSLGGLINDLYNLVYPVGICIDFDNATNPNTTFPGTTWVQILDNRVVRTSTSATVGTSPGQIGAIAGNDTITLVEANLPKHVHWIDHSHGMYFNSGGGGAHQHTVSGTTSDNGWHAHGIAMKGQNYGGSNGITASNSAAATGYMDTNGAGTHNHWWGGDSSWIGDHVHLISGNTGGASMANSGGGNGSSASINAANSCHYYARWKRTA